MQDMNDFATNYSLSFILRHLPEHGCRILEVGRGDGHLARALVDLGHDVVAVDSDPDAVSRACSRGVNAWHAVWPEFAETSFDFVLFTRSLHHIHPIREAVDRALEVLNNGGTIIIEDFDYTVADTTTTRWFAATIQMLQLAGAIDIWLLRSQATGYCFASGSCTLIRASFSLSSVSAAAPSANYDKLKFVGHASHELLHQLIEGLFVQSELLID